LGTFGQPDASRRRIPLEGVQEMGRTADCPVFRNLVAHSGTNAQNLEPSSVQVKGTPAEIEGKLQESRVIGIARLKDAESVINAGLESAAHGLAALEVPFTVPGATEAIEALRARLGANVLVGAGTVRTNQQVKWAVDAGAQFLVAPGINLSVVETARAAGVLLVPGVYTATEVDLALRLGLTFLKLFPAIPAGPEYMAALLQPFPEARFVPTGGVGPENAWAFIKAGAAALGMGSSVFPARRIEADGLRVIGPLIRTALERARVEA
jgi:2-dehydro-3-deoxyphosphogluconate aldolase / (4S)-4-hydroxy-2-oxoglutarate aldolase